MLNDGIFFLINSIWLKLVSKKWLIFNVIHCKSSCVLLLLIYSLLGGMHFIKLFSFKLDKFYTHNII